MAKKSSKSPSSPLELGPAVHQDAQRYLREHVRSVPDHPVRGVTFRDLSPLLADPRALALSGFAISSHFVGAQLDAVVALEGRGFVFGALVAERLNLGFVEVSRAAQFAAETDSVSYSREQARAELHLRSGALSRGAKVLVVDEVLATGGTASAAGELVRRAGGQVSAYVFVVELVGRRGRAALGPTPVVSLVQFE